MDDRNDTNGQFAERWATQADKLEHYAYNDGYCINWTGTLDKDGYGKFYWKGRHLRAHRVAWEIINGDLADEALVCHHCDNPTCIRIDHLFLGTHQDNADDKMIKGRHDGNKLRLTINDVQDMREMLASGISQQRVADKYKISQQTVSNIKNRAGRFIGDEVW